MEYNSRGNRGSDSNQPERVARGCFEITSTITPELYDTKSYYQLIVSIGTLKAWQNACNISTQHLATLLGTTCSIRLATLLRYVAIRCNMLDDVGSNLKTVKFFVQHFGCCMMLYSFGLAHTTFLD